MSGLERLECCKKSGIARSWRRAVEWHQQKLLQSWSYSSVLLIIDHFQEELLNILRAGGDVILTAFVEWDESSGMFTAERLVLGDPFVDQGIEGGLRLRFPEGWRSFR